MTKVILKKFARKNPLYVREQKGTLRYAQSDTDGKWNFEIKRRRVKT
jgi:hypothetical protein